MDLPAEIKQLDFLPETPGGIHYVSVDRSFRISLHTTQANGQYFYIQQGYNTGFLTKTYSIKKPHLLLTRLIKHLRKLDYAPAIAQHRRRMLTLLLPTDELN